MRPFEAKYLATPIDLRRAIAYVHRNPKNPELIRKFTSHPAYLAEDRSSFVNVDRGLAAFGGRDAYADYFEKYCRAKRRRGRPLSEIRAARINHRGIRQDIHNCWLPALECTFEGGAQLIRGLDELAVAPEGLGDRVVTHTGRQLGRD